MILAFNFAQPNMFELLDTTQSQQIYRWNLICISLPRRLIHFTRSVFNFWTKSIPYLRYFTNDSHFTLSIFLFVCLSASCPHALRIPSQLWHRTTATVIKCFVPYKLIEFAESTRNMELIARNRVDQWCINMVSANVVWFCFSLTIIIMVPAISFTLLHFKPFDSVLLCESKIRKNSVFCFFYRFDAIYWIIFNF